jgi:hypothetical protein
MSSSLLQPILTELETGREAFLAQICGLSQEQLDEARGALMGTAQAAERKHLAHLSFPHPYLGRLDFYQWLLFVAEHVQGHTEQLIRTQEGWKT